MQLLRLACEPIRSDQQCSAPQLPEGMSGVVWFVTSQAACPDWAITDIGGAIALNYWFWTLDE